MSPKRLAIITTHPIQYHAPWYRALALNPEIELEVFYCHRATPKEQADAGFGVEFDWDVSLLDGYSHHFLKNVAERPAVSGFNGLDTPEIQAVIARERFDAVMVNGWHYKSAWQTTYRLRRLRSSSPANLWQRNDQLTSFEQFMPRQRKVRG